MNMMTKDRRTMTIKQAPFSCAPLVFRRFAEVLQRLVYNIGPSYHKK